VATATVGVVLRDAGGAAKSAPLGRKGWQYRKAVPLGKEPLPLQRIGGVLSIEGRCEFQAFDVTIQFVLSTESARAREGVQ